MFFRILADVTLLVHMAFIIFVCSGAILTVFWRWIPVIHIPSVVWGVYIELSGKFCPLTHIENSLLLKAGQAGYGESFIEHYLLNIIYPPGLTRGVQFLLAGGLFALNVALYAWLMHRHLALKKRKTRVD